MPTQVVATVQHAALTWLRDQIASGRYAPGERLRQESLARDFGASVPPVREALKTLEAEGQVVYSPRRGYVVAALSATEVTETYRIRDLLETEATVRAVGSLSAADVVRMQDAVQEMERADAADDVRALTLANRRFHFTIYDGAGMPRMAELIRVLWDSTDRYRARYYADPQHRRHVNDEHRAIMAAVVAGDGPRTADLLRAHRERALEALRAALDQNDPSSSPRGEP
jgi:DNA-binding GntR family transcriptional regulator